MRVDMILIHTLYFISVDQESYQKDDIQRETSVLEQVIWSFGLQQKYIV
jgi:hypothetical protein